MSSFAKLLGISVLVLSAVGIASAQIADTVLRVNIPKPFAVRGTVLPAGDYTIKRTSLTSGSSSVLLLQGKGGSVFFDTIPTISATAAKDTRLIFGKADGQLFLSEIWVSGQTVGNEVVGARSEAAKVARAKARKSKTGDTTGF